MGSYVSSSSDKGHEAKLLKEYLVKLYALDDAAFGLFNAVDAMDAAASSLEQELQAGFDCTDQKETRSRLEQYRKLAARLLTTSKCALLHQKKLANYSLISFLNFIKDGIIRNVKSTEENFRKLSIETFEDDRKQLDSEKEKNPLEPLLIKIEEQNNEMKSLKDRIKIVKERETTYVKEENAQRERIQYLEKTASEESEKRKTETEEMRKANIVFQTQLQKASKYETKYNDQKERLQCLEIEHQKKLADYEKNLVENKEKIKDLDNENEELKKNLEILRRVVASSEKEHQQKLADYKCDLAEKEEQIQNLDNVNEKTKNTVKDLQLTLESLEKENNQTMADYKNNLTEKEERIRNVKNENEEVKKNVEDLQRTNENLKIEIQQNMADYKKNLAENETQIQNLDNENEKLKNCLEEWKRSHESFENDNKKLERSLEELRSSDERHTEVIMALRQVKSDLEHKLNEKDNVLKEITGKYVALTDSFEKQKQKYKGEKENLNSEIQTLNQTVESLSLEKKLRLKSDEELKRTKQIYEDNLQDLKDKLAEEKNKEQLYIEKNDNEISKHTEEIRKAQNEFSEMVSKYESEKQKLKSLHLVRQKELENKMYQANQDKEKLNIVLQELKLNCKTEFEKKDKIIADQKSDNKSLNEKIVQLERNFESLTREKDEEKKNLTDTISAERVTVKNLKHALKDKEVTIHCQEKECASLLAKLKIERDNLQKSHIECASKNADLTEVKSHFMKLKERNKELEKVIEHQSRITDSLQKELDHIKAKKRVPVQLYTQKRSELTDKVGESIIHLLKKEFASDRLELDFWKCSRISDIHPNYPLLVICVTVSRIGTDVANAIHGISLSPNMAVMVFHHKDEHALPNQLSERILTGKELKDIGGIYDMAYFSGKGIYPCEMNRNSADSLVTFIKRVARNIHP